MNIVTVFKKGGKNYELCLSLRWKTEMEHEKWLTGCFMPFLVLIPLKVWSLYLRSTSDLRYGCYALDLRYGYLLCLCSKVRYGCQSWDKGMDVIPQLWNYFTPHFTFYTTLRSLKTFFLILFINIKLGLKKVKGTNMSFRRRQVTISDYELT